MAPAWLAIGLLPSKERAKPCPRPLPPTARFALALAACPFSSFRLLLPDCNFFFPPNTAPRNTQQPSVKRVLSAYVDGTTEACQYCLTSVRRISLSRLHISRRFACALWQAASPRSTTLTSPAFLCSLRTTLSPPCRFLVLPTLPLSRYGYHSPTFLWLTTA